MAHSVLSQTQQQSGNSKWGRKETSLVPVPCRQGGNGGCYSCSSQHWGSSQALSDAPKGDLGVLHPSTFNQTQQQHSAFGPGCISRICAGMCCTLTPAPAEDEEQLFTDVRQLLDPPGPIYCNEEKGSGAPPSALAPGGCSDCSAWCSGWKLRVVLPVRQPKGNLWKDVSYAFLKETYPESKSHEFNKYS